MTKQKKRALQKFLADTDTKKHKKPKTESVGVFTTKEEEDTGTIGEAITDSFKVKQSKPLMKDTHMRTSFLFRKDLRHRLNILSDYYGRGYRTHFINNALENAIISAEQQMEQDMNR